MAKTQRGSPVGRHVKHTHTHRHRQSRTLVQQAHHGRTGVRGRGRRAPQKQRGREVPRPPLSRAVPERNKKRQRRERQGRARGTEKPGSRLRSTEKPFHGAEKTKGVRRGERTGKRPSPQKQTQEKSTHKRAHRHVKAPIQVGTRAGKRAKLSTSAGANAADLKKRSTQTLTHVPKQCERRVARVPLPLFPVSTTPPARLAVRIEKWKRVLVFVLACSGSSTCRDLLDCESPS